MADSMDAPRDDSPSETRSRPDGALTRRRVLAAMTATTVVGPAVAGLAGAESSGRESNGLEPDGAGRSGASRGDTGWDVGDVPDDLAVTREEVFVETSVDSNDSGEPDRIFVDVLRPQQEDGGQAPVITIASPYNGEQTHGDSTPEMMYDRELELSASRGESTDAGTRTDAESGDGTDGARSGGRDASEVPGHRPRVVGIGDRWRVDAVRYLQQGYAVARASSLGTHRSTGCYTAAAPVTFEALSSVVDWFNGRARAYDAREGGTEVTADWASGKTGMIGTSANGELANGVATTGVDGLEAIVPISANAGQYSLFRANGTPISVVPDGEGAMPDLGTWVQAGTARRPACDHWVERVEVGQDRETGDYNDFWHERSFLPEAGEVQAAVLLAHGVNDQTVKPNYVAQWYETLVANDVPVRLWLHQGGHESPGVDEWDALVERWWDHWLRDEDNGVVDEDPVTIHHDGTGVSSGPMETYESWPIPDADPVSIRFGPGGRTAGVATVAEHDPVEETFVDDPATPAADLAAAAESTHRLRYRTPPLAEAVHVSGRVVPNLAVSFDDPTVVSVALVEYGSRGPTVVTRGWADPLNRPSYGEYDSPLAYKESLRESRPLEAGEQVQVEFPLQVTDHVFDPGSRIGLVVYASDKNFTLYPPGNAEVALSLGESSVAVPVVGGESALTGAFRADETGTADGRTATGAAATGRDSDGTGTSDDPSAGGQSGGDAETGADRVPTTADPSGSGGDATATDGPGFGLGGALAAIGGVGYRLRRRLGVDDDSATATGEHGRSE